MFDKKLACTILALLVVTVGTIWFVDRATQPPAAPIRQEVEGVRRERAQALRRTPESTPEYAYVLREYEGRIAVFSAENDHEPEMILNTLVKYLPDYDRTQMQDGIRVKDYEELVALMEDLTS